MPFAIRVYVSTPQLTVIIPEWFASIIPHAIELTIEDFSIVYVVTIMMHYIPWNRVAIELNYIYCTLCRL